MRVDLPAVSRDRIEKLVDRRVADALAAVARRLEESAGSCRTVHPPRAAALRAVALDLQDVVRDLRGE